MLLGERIKRERQLRKLSLLDVASDCGISEAQLYRIENNEVNVRRSTLLKLINYYGFDMMDNYSKVIDSEVISILKQINSDIKSRDINNIKNALNIIEYINNKSTNIVVSGVAKQYHHLINGLIRLNEKNYLSARESFLNGIKSFNAFINTYTFNNIGSSSIQLRLLMAYAITFRAEKDYEKCLYLLNKVLANVKNNNLLYKKVIYNISNMYSLIENYNKSVSILDNYLSYRYPSTDINYDNIIFFKKATVSYRIGCDSYKKYALRSLYSSILSNDINNGLIFLNVFNNLFDDPIMTKESFLNL